MRGLDKKEKWGFWGDRSSRTRQERGLGGAIVLEK